MAVLGDLNLGSLSLPAYAMQNFCDSRSYLTARSPIESSRRAESISHLFIAQRHFSTLISWSGSSFIRRGKDIFAKRLYLVIWLRTRAENGAAKPGAGHPAFSKEQREGTDLGLFSHFLAGLSEARGQPGQCPAWPGGTNRPPKQPKPEPHIPNG